MRVSFFKQNKVNRLHKNSLKKAIDELIDGKSPIVLGKFAKEFENQYSRYIGSKYCSFVSNGLDALTIALKVIDIKEGDEILVPNHTYIATWLAVLNVGATIVPVPVKNDSLIIDENKIENLITSKTKAIIPVHLYGNVANIDHIKKLAKNYKLFIIDDAAQAHGSMSGDKKIGNYFDMSCFSFYPTKNLGALGEAGCITTNNTEFYNKINSIRNYGKSLMNPSINLYQGSNYRGDELQAAFLISKLKKLEEIIQKRNNILKIYQNLNKSEVSQYLRLITYSKFASPHLAVIKVNNIFIRNSLIEYLKENNIETMIHYINPCHKQSFIKKNQIRISDNVAKQAEEISNTILSLPMSEVHSIEEINYVIKCIKKFFMEINLN